MLAFFRRYRVAVALLILLAIAGWFLPLRGLDQETAIRRFVAELEAAVAKTTAETPALQIGAGRRLGRCFAERFVISGDVRELAGHYDRQSAVGMAVQARSQWARIELAIQNLKVSFSSDSEAVVYGRGQLQLSTADGKTEVIRRQLHMVIGKNADGDWNLKAVQALGRDR